MDPGSQWTSIRPDFSIEDEKLKTHIISINLIMFFLFISSGYSWDSASTCNFHSWLKIEKSGLLTDETEPKGFRGILWETHPNDLPEAYYRIKEIDYLGDTCISRFRNKNEKMSVGSIQIDNVDYYFLNDKFYKVAFSFRAKKNIDNSTPYAYDFPLFDAMLEIFTKRFGPPKKGNEWEGEKVNIKILSNYDTHKSILSSSAVFTFKPLSELYWKCFNEEKKRRLGESAKEF
jgi:hypothetical protein